MINWVHSETLIKGKKEEEEMGCERETEREKL